MQVYLTKNTRKLLEMLSMGIVIIVVGQSIKGSQSLIKHFGNLTAQELYNLKRKIDKLQRAKLVHLSGDKVKLSTLGKSILEEHSIEKLKIPHGVFDGSWQVISWDIPTNKRKISDLFRKQLKHWGFEPIHASLWVFPWRCKAQIATLAKWYNLSNYIIYLEIEHLPKQVEKRLKSKFGIT